MGQETNFSNCRRGVNRKFRKPASFLNGQIRTRNGEIPRPVFRVQFGGFQCVILRNRLIWRGRRSSRIGRGLGERGQREEERRKEGKRVALSGLRTIFVLKRLVLHHPLDKLL